MTANKSNTATIQEKITELGREYNLNAVAIQGLLCHIVSVITNTGINNYASLSNEAQMDVIKKATASYVEKADAADVPQKH